MNILEEPSASVQFLRVVAVLSVAGTATAVPGKLDTQNIEQRTGAKGRSMIVIA